MLNSIRLDIDFDNGSLNVGASRVEGDLIRLVGFENHNAGFWKWLHFRVSGARGRTLQFEIDNRFEPGADRLDQHRMVYSYDRITWDFLPENHHDGESRTYRFGLGKPFAESQVFIAYGIPYPFSRMRAFVDSIRDRPYIGPTPGSDDRLVIGMSPGGEAEGGRSIGPNELYGFLIREQSDVPDRRKIVIFGGVHPNEPLGNWGIEGLVGWLLDDTTGARHVRRHADIFVYPMINPDGRVAGYNRSTVQHEDRDANRVWRCDLYEDMDDIRQIAEAAKKDTDGKVDYFIDFHCWTNTSAHFGIMARAEGFHRNPFWLAMRELEPTLEEMDSGWENWSTETFAFKVLNARFAMTLETMFIPGENIDRFKELGRNVGRALARVIGT